ncbi:hypothetical protein CPB84DRAFT_1780580 [Gymnopilus junonius]|uniref:MYND-type domain-containing protein n=1 Tax=Gymnopilus junonius TaxID=109634 RepID=A0A9P5TLJ5_GYMJU|nr:hypothetical protein CPB84DRAFT_1780580 [Gymnopilus junonius]
MAHSHSLLGAGKCDLDKKPSYCSKKCQKADWKNHKPFCNPRASCSVVDPQVHPTNVGVPATVGAIGIPARREHGGTMYMISPEMGPDELKEYWEFALQHLSMFSPIAVLNRN